MAKYIIREANQDDLSNITLLRHTIREFRTIGTEEYRSFWNSKIYNNFYSIRHVYVGVNEKNEIMGHLAMIPLKFLRDGEPLFGGSLCELMVHADCRQELLFPRLEMKILNGYKDLGIDFAYGMANRGEVMNAHLSFGFNKIGDLVVYAKPYKLEGIARRFISNSILSMLMKPSLYIAERLLRLNATSGKMDLEVTEISGFDPSIDQFLTEVQSHFPYSAIRNSAILNWRFKNTPSVQYQILAAKEDGKIVGYAVLRRIAMKRFDVLAVVDILFSPQRPYVGQSLMKAVHEKSVQLKVEMSACLLNPFDPLCPVIRKCGYFKSPETFALIIHEPKGTTPRFSKDSFDKWHLTWFDHDAV